MSSLMISTNAVKEKVNQLTQLNSEFVSMVNDMSDQVTSLCNMWEGDARDVFLKNYGTSTQQFKAFSQGIQQYCQALAAMAEEHDRNEAANADIAASRS